MAKLPIDIPIELNESGEAEAWANVYQCTPSDFGRKFGIEVHHFGSVWVTLAAGLDAAFFNRMVGFGVGEPATEADVDKAIGYLQRAGCKNFMAQISPLALPARLPDWLNERGFVRGENWVKMYRAGSPAPVMNTDLRVEQIGLEHADGFANVALEAFGMPEVLRPMLTGVIGKPGWRCYAAFDGDLPVSAAALRINGKTGWLGFGSTLRSYRGRGGQSALFARRITDGAAAGCQWLVTETGEETPRSHNPSYHNMLRSGFRLAYARANYIYSKTKVDS